ncbi:MAG: HAMP domain-containing histidine kinase [Anaerolineae bacterium]|nr:HAMP domain-containing histidine kinase [Anaerolineae bacterium]
MMNENEEIYNMLHERRLIIAQAWFEALKEATPLPLNHNEYQSRFVEYTNTLIQILTASPFNPAPIQEMGKNLEIVDNIQPEGIIKIQRILAEQILESLSPEHRCNLQSRLIEALSALLTGFFLGKAERAKRFDMESMSRMGHDLKTPINAITGFSRVILKGIDGPITEFQQEDLTSIHEAGQKLLTMINDLFETAKNDARKTHLYLPTFDIAELLGDVMTTVQPVLAKRKHTLEIQVAGMLGTMRANASMVRWMVLSLLLYASRLAEHRTISLMVMRERVQNTDSFTFEVSETLPDEILSQVIASGNANQDGTIPLEAEIGLVVCERFCKEMGGTLEMAIGENGLAKLTLHLPAYVSAPEPMPQKDIA